MVADGGEVEVLQPIGDGTFVREHFVGGNDAVGGGGKEFLAEHTEQFRGEEGEGESALVRGEQVSEAFEGVGGVGAVEGGEDEVSGFRGLESGDGGFGVADFADHDDVGALSERGAQAGGEGWGVGADFPLGEPALIGGEEVFDGIFEGDDVAGGSLVEMAEQGGDGGGFSGTGGSADEE